MACQYTFIDCNKCTTLVRNFDTRGAVPMCVLTGKGLRMLDKAAGRGT